MNKQIAFAYGIAGLAVAAAFITYITAPTEGFDTGVMPEQAQVSTLEQPIAAPEGVVLAQAAPQEVLPPEYVYVDEPAAPRRHGDDDDRGEGRERDDDRGHGEHRDHDDDDD
jgi:hypothetical protein